MVNMTSQISWTSSLRKLFFTAAICLGPLSASAITSYNLSIIFLCSISETRLTDVSITR